MPKSEIQSSANAGVLRKTTPVEGLPSQRIYARKAGIERSGTDVIACTLALLTDPLLKKGVEATEPVAPPFYYAKLSV